MPHFKREKEMGHFGIGMHIHASGLSEIGYLCRSHFGAFRRPFWDDGKSNFLCPVYFMRPGNSVNVPGNFV